MTTQPATRIDGRSEHARRFVDAHFRGRISGRDEREMRAHLVTCVDCRAYYDRHLHLAAVDPGGSLPAAERLARGLGLRTRGARAHHLKTWLSLAAGACAAAAAIAIVVRTHPPSDFEPRGPALGSSSQLLAYEVPRGAAPRPIAAEMRADSALAFAYANVARKARLMVFAVDENRQTYWYQPAWRSAAENPVAIEIARDGALHEITQATTHRFSGRRLQVFGVFLDQPTSVREMEAWIAEAPSDGRGGIRLAVDRADISHVQVALRPVP
ncbi:MAG TPA: zf-HC2 domain-containing protein [Polyangia bacterium]|jgi:hypothetical protein